MKRWLPAVLLAAFACLPARLAGAAPYAHDPAAIVAGDTLYVFATGSGVPVYKSTDRENWSKVGAALDSLPAWIGETVPGYGGRLWAPDISFRDGLYWLYYSASTFGSNNSAIGLATSRSLDPDSPDYAWEDRGPVLVSREGEDIWNAIDPAAFEDADGGTWLAWGSFWSGIWIVRTDRSTGLPESGAEPVLAAARPDSPDNAVEAPFVFRHGRFYYLFVSRDYCCRGSSSDYNVVVGRSRTPDGPYRDRRGHLLTEGGGTPVLAGDERFPGKGHVGVFSDEGKDYLAYHAYDSERGGIAMLKIDEIDWTPSGWLKTVSPEEEEP